MDDALDRLSAHDRRQVFGLGDVADDAGGAREWAVGIERLQVVDDHAMAAPEELAHGVGSDVTGAAGDEYVHGCAS